MSKITPTQIYQFLNKERNDFGLWAGNYKSEIEELTDYINDQIIDARINENTFYLGYDKNVHECVWRDADNRIFNLTKEKS